MHLQFESWSACTISNLFWKRLAEVKVDELGSGRCRRRIWAFYQLGGSSALLSLHLTAESLQPEQPSRVAELGKNFFCLPGELQLADSIEEFKALDRHAEATRIAQENRQVDLKSGFLPNFFVLFAFADVKRYRFYHQIAYPVLLLSAPFLVVGSIESWQQSQSSNEPAQCTAASVIVDNDLVSIADPCNGRTACWPLRQVLTNQSFAGRTIRIQAHDRTFTVAVPSMQDGNSDTGITGWERSREDPRRIAPVKCTDLSSLFDPCQLAKQAAELNLKLMKWRLVPQLDLSRLSRTSCLLIGSGTLGCNIARVLTGWGFRHITFVDCGKVSYSNPVRQSLFTFEDARDGKLKAHAAADRLKQVDPNAIVCGVELKVPMPGHPVTDEDELTSQHNLLSKLISEHDVIFLLTDSRESRWLPAVIACSLGKIVITVALGFDSYVAMRHGINRCRSADSVDSSNSSNSVESSNSSNNNKPSCYFCHDVIGPSDTMTGRPLDQQCTVTRPGLSFVAAGQAVELLVSLLQDGVLGPTPHQIRGTMSSFECFCLTGEASEHCTACSPAIQAAYKQCPLEFLRRACDAPSELERISGLSAMKEMSESIISLSFESSDSDVDSDGFERL